MESAVQEETRERRLRALMAASREGARLGPLSGTGPVTGLARLPLPANASSPLLASLRFLLLGPSSAGVCARSSCSARRETERTGARDVRRRRAAGAPGDPRRARPGPGPADPARHHAPIPWARASTRLRASVPLGQLLLVDPGRARRDARADRRFLIDGETRTLDLSLTRGLSASTDVTLRLPLRWRGGGALDGFIDAWHRTFAFLGIADGDRPAFRQDAFRVEGVTTRRTALLLERRDRHRPRQPGARRRAGASARDGTACRARRAASPSPPPPRPTRAPWGGGLQLVARRPLARSLDLHAGRGRHASKASGPGARHPLRAGARPRAPAPCAYRPWRVAQPLGGDRRREPPRRATSTATRASTGSSTAGSKLAAVSRRPCWSSGITENLKSQLSTTDFAVYFAVSARP